MEIEGTKPGRNRTTVTLARPEGGAITLIVTALPLGFWGDVDKWIPPPQPPQKGFVRDGTKAVKDSEGRPIPEFDESDPDYLAKKEEVTRLQNAICVVEALRDEPKVKFVAKPHKNRMPEYAQAVLDEMADFGLSDSDFVQLTRSIMLASIITPDMLGAKREDFLAEKAEKDGTPDTES